MTESTLADVAGRYLAALDQALAGLPGEVRTGILTGVREELEGLSAADAAVRIRDLGDPEFIAADARSDTPQPVSATPTPAREARWYPVVAALLVMVGGIVLPVLGTVAGLVMVWFSTAWTRTEKWVATLIPVAVVVLLGATGVVVAVASTGQAGPAGDGPSPLIPGPVDVVTLGIVLLVVVQVGVGIWLLVRAAKRG